MINRRKFLKTSLSSLALLSLPKISLAQNNYDVVVIGAGASGLAATSNLMASGKSVLCIEAMSRKGGRCHTDNSIFGVPYDMGAHWLHQYSKNQIAEFGKKHKDKFNIYKAKEPLMIYDGEKKIKGFKLGKLYSKVEKKQWKKNDIPSKDEPFMSQIPEKWKKNKWFHSVHQLLGPCQPAVDFDDYTLNDSHTNSTHQGEGDGYVKEGYGTLLAYYRRDVPVKLKTVVNEIKWGGKGVQIETNQGTISAKTCVITVSVAVLNAGKIKFSPALPLEKYEAFDGIRLGTYNHITFQLKDDFYKKYKVKDDTYFVNRIENTINGSPAGSCATLKISGTNISYFDVGGKFAQHLEAEGKDASVDFVLNRLRSAFGSKIDKYFIKAHVTAWGKNPFTLGSYSSAIPGKSHLRKKLKIPVADKLFFAGEATTGVYATCHGADLSGERAAKQVLNFI